MPNSKKKVVVRRAKPVALLGRIKVLKKDNPFIDHPKSGRFKRAKAVLSCHGKTVEAAMKKGAWRSTARWMRDHKRISITA